MLLLLLMNSLIWAGAFLLFGAGLHFFLGAFLLFGAGQWVNYFFRAKTPIPIKNILHVVAQLRR